MGGVSCRPLLRCPHTHPGSTSRRRCSDQLQAESPRAQTTDQILKERRSPQGPPARTFRTTPAPGRTCTPARAGLGEGGPAIYRRLEGSRGWTLTLPFPAPGSQAGSTDEARARVCGPLQAADHEHLPGDPRGGKQPGDWLRSARHKVAMVCSSDKARHMASLLVGFSHRTFDIMSKQPMHKFQNPVLGFGARGR